MVTTTETARSNALAARYARAPLIGPRNPPFIRNDRISPRWVDGSPGFIYERQGAEGVESIYVGADGARRAATEAERPAAQAQRDPKQLLSPDGKTALIARDHDLWLIDSASGAERRLTDDGVEGYSWGAYPDSGLLSIPRQRTGLPFPPFGFSWSPDGTYLVGGRVDERGVEPTAFIEQAPSDGGFRPKAWMVRQGLLGDPTPPTEAVAFEVATGRRVVFELPAGAALQEPLGWNGDLMIALATFDKSRTLAVVEIDAASGRVRPVLTESPSGFAQLNTALYNAPNVRLVKGGAELLWFSERSGWGHLYRYRVADGALLNAVTAGEWLVRDIIAIDEARGRVFFTGSGREAGNPYLRYLYRVNFDGGDLRLLTPEAADHAIPGAPNSAFAAQFGAKPPQPAVSPDGGVFIDSYSTLDHPTVHVLRSTEDGRVIATIERADTSELDALGAQPPIPFAAKALDGTTDLYGVLYLPDGFEHAPAGSVPLIDAMYGGPQVVATPHNHSEAFQAAFSARYALGLRALGFAVMVVDGRGTPGRSQAFHDLGYTPAFADLCTDDHAAVIEQLIAAHPALDGNRVGVTGHSFGGLCSTRAMLRRPDVFKVAVSSAGVHLAEAGYSLAAFLPAPVYEDGGSVRPTPQSRAANWSGFDNAALASKLEGKMLLAWGDADENAPPASTAHLINAFIKADKRVDHLYLPNRTHGFPNETYFTHRLWDYFLEHLMGVSPPSTATPQ